MFKRRVAYRVVAMAALCVTLTVASAACMRQDRRLEQHQKAFESLDSTTRATVDAWLAGHVSGTYTRTALEQAFLLIEEERAALAKRPTALTDSRAARLSDTADHMERVVADLISAVRAADAAAARRDLASFSVQHDREQR